MKKHFFIIGDIEIGKKDIMDEFSDDKALIEFIEEIQTKTRDENLILVLNGDFFDFLKMDFKGIYPEHITEEVSLWKLERIMEAHPAVLGSLKQFVQNLNHQLYFILGNHDADLAWPLVQKKICAYLGKNANITFSFAYDEGDIHIEHGQLLDAFCRIDSKKPILRIKGKQVLNTPIAYRIFFKYLIPLKLKFHKEEQFFPQEAVFKHFPKYEKKIRKIAWLVAGRIFLLDPILHWNDPTYRVPYLSIAKHLWRHGNTSDHDDRFLDMASLAKEFPEKKLHVLSHAHVFKDLQRYGQRFMVLDSWSDEYYFFSGTIQKKSRTFAEIVMDNGHVISAEMKIFMTANERHHQTIQKSQKETSVSLVA